ncbi:MAG: septation protein SpoVG family protein [Fibrobacterota bacterium]
MTITNINLSMNRNAQSKRVAFGSIELDKVLVVTGISVFTGEKGKFVKMPQATKAGGKYQDVVFPTTAELRKEITDQVLAKFETLKSSAN